MQPSMKSLIFCLLLLTGCQSPFLTFPGKALPGELTRTESFDFAAEYPLLQLETNPDAPYSVWLRTTVIDGGLYVDAAPARQWGRHLQRSPEVKVKLGERVYPALAVEVTAPEITEKFIAGRRIYRLEPRQF